MKDVLEESQKLFVDLIDKLEAYIPKENNLELIILKGHILLEYFMDKIIELLSDATFDMSKTNFRFYDKANIINILGVTPDTLNTYEILIKFNSIRNDIAHELDYNRNHINELIILIFQGSRFEKIKSETDVERSKALRVVIPIIMGQILAGLHLKNLPTLRPDEIRKKVFLKSNIK